MISASFLRRHARPWVSCYRGRMKPACLGLRQSRSWRVAGARWDSARISWSTRFESRRSVRLERSARDGRDLRVGRRRRQSFGGAYDERAHTGGALGEVRERGRRTGLALFVRFMVPSGATAQDADGDDASTLAASTATALGRSLGARVWLRSSTTTRSKGSGSPTSRAGNDATLGGENPTRMPTLVPSGLPASVAP